MTSQPRRLSQVVVVGLLSGAVYGVLQGLGDRSISKGTISGLIFGAVMAVAHYATLRTNAHLAGLRPREQRMVSAAVRRGEAVTDPALAGHAVHLARNVQCLPGGQRLGRLLAWGLLAASVVELSLSVWSGSIPGVVAGTFSCVVWVIILVLGPRLERHVQDRARAAEMANRRVVASSATPRRG
jgi:hypothetical protein